MRSAKLAIVLFAAFAACTNTPTPSPRLTTTPTPTQTPTVSPTTPAPTPPAPVALKVVYMISDRETSDRSKWFDIFLYDIASNRVKRLTANGQNKLEYDPHFRGSAVTFVVDGKGLDEINPATGKRRRLFSVGGKINTHGWNPARTEVAYIERLESGARRLRVHSTITGRTTTLKNLGTIDGRGTGDFDAETIVWSANGDRVLVNDSYQSRNPTVRIVRRTDGADMIEPLRDVTQAIWAADEKSIYFLETPRVRPEPGGWHRLDLTNQRRSPLNLKPGSIHPALSPDGTRLAATFFDPDTKVQTTYVLDLRTGRQTRLAKGYRDALWLDADAVVLTRLVPCRSGTACEYYGYRATGTRRITMTRSVEAISLGTTLWDGLGRRNTDILFE